MQETVLYKMLIIGLVFVFLFKTRFEVAEVTSENKLFSCQLGAVTCNNNLQNTRRFCDG
jgi:hypothetical protein